MLELTLQTFLTLDGVYQAPGGAEEDTEGGFKHGGWQGPMFDEDAGKIITGQMSETKAMLMGRKTYDIFRRLLADRHRGRGDREDVQCDAQVRRLSHHEESRLAGHDRHRLEPGARRSPRPKQQDGPGVIYIPGSGNLAQSLIKQNLIDEYRLWIHPIMLGSGKRLFADGVVPTNLKLIDKKTTGSGIVILTYRPDAEAEVGAR